MDELKNNAPQTPGMMPETSTMAQPSAPQREEAYTPAPGEPRLGRAAEAPIAEKKSGAVGPMVGAIIVIAILIAGALYFFGTNGMLPFADMATWQGGAENGALTESQNTPSDADVNAQATAADQDMSTLEADLNASMKDLDGSL